VFIGIAICCGQKHNCLYWDSYMLRSEIRHHQASNKIIQKEGKSVIYRTSSCLIICGNPQVFRFLVETCSCHNKYGRFRLTTESVLTVTLKHSGINSIKLHLSKLGPIIFTAIIFQQKAKPSSICSVTKRFSGPSLISIT
jgi:hypothetical protein